MRGAAGSGVPYDADVRNACVVVVMSVLAGCASPPGGFDSPVPAERLKAMSRAAKDGDQSAVPKVIGFLNSDDPVVRLTAIRTLESLTGQTLGYDHAAPEAQRRQMAGVWVEWYNRGGPAGRGVKEGGADIKEGEEQVGGRSGSVGLGSGNADTVR